MLLVFQMKSTLKNGAVIVYSKDEVYKCDMIIKIEPPLSLS